MTRGKERPLPPRAPSLYHRRHAPPPPRALAVTAASLAFHGPLTIALFWASFVLWNLFEIAVNARRRPGAEHTRWDRGSYRVLAVSISLAFAAAFTATLALPGAALPAQRLFFALGIACVLAGTALRGYAVASLGRFFTVQVATHAAQTVIDSGPYRLIRHPAYTGQLLALIGFALALGNGAGVLAVLVLAGPGYAYRIKVEEAALLASLGDAYARYTRRTWRLIPYLI